MRCRLQLRDLHWDAFAWEIRERTYLRQPAATRPQRETTSELESEELKLISRKDTTVNGNALELPQ